MEFQRHLCLFLVLFSLVSVSKAYKFYVGGNNGWVPNPAENYNEWAGRNRFQVNDTLVFKYKKGSDSVLEVKKEDYDKCNKSEPIKKFEEGDTEFKFDRSGPFYFISGKDGNCEKGQKLIVVVLAIRGGGRGGQTPTPPPSKSPSPLSHPPATSPPSKSPSPSPLSQPPATSPSSKSPSPLSHPPATSPPSKPPSPSPLSSPPSGNAPSPSVLQPPVGTPESASGPPSPSPSGSQGPATSEPAPPGFGPITSPSPSTQPPPASPPSPSPSPPSTVPGTAQTPASSNETVPPPGNGGLSETPSRFLVYAVTIVVGAVLLR